MYDSRCRMQCTCSRLEHRFRYVVLIAAVKIFDVQIEAAFLHEGFKELFDQFRLEIANARRFEIRLVDEIWSAGEIDNNASQCFIQRHISVAET